MNRIHRTAAVLATSGAVIASQVGFAGAASAATPGCPIKISTPSRFYVDSNGWVTNGGLYFGIKGTSKKHFKNVRFTVKNVKNIRFGKATPTKYDKITKQWKQVITVKDKNMAGKKDKVGFKVRTRLLNTNVYKVKLILRGEGWSCAVNQGTWGNR
ncbi:hypothetical protein [Streptomyces sp. NPDC002845]